MSSRKTITKSCKGRQFEGVLYAGRSRPRICSKGKRHILQSRSQNAHRSMRTVAHVTSLYVQPCENTRM